MPTTAELKGACEQLGGHYTGGVCKGLNPLVAGAYRDVYRRAGLDPSNVVARAGNLQRLANVGRTIGSQLLGGANLTDALVAGGNALVAPTSSSPIGRTGAGQCPVGQISILGACVNPPFGGAPGAGLNTIGTPAHTAYGEAVVGAFGTPALVPAQVGEINGRPIRRCPPGAVLGKDDLCYMKGSIPRQFRKWAPAAKPPVSAYDARMMRKYGPGGSKQKKIKSLAMDAGFACKKK